MCARWCTFITWLVLRGPKNIASSQSLMCIRENALTNTYKAVEFILLIGLQNTLIKTGSMYALQSLARFPFLSHIFTILI